MIVIDVSSEQKLAQMLELFRLEPDATRIIHCKFSQNPAHVALLKANRETLVHFIQHYLTSGTPHVYFCEDGDVFIVGAQMLTREAHALMLAIGDFFTMPVTDVFVEYCEVNRHINRLLMAVEEKMERQRLVREAEARALAAQQAERKRQAILNSGTHASLRDISARRSARPTAELMLIEDDSFSRKLVENVLGKHYSMTCLGTADQALATYARLAPNMLFLDIDLPDVTGHELLEKIIALDPDAYVVMLSGNADRENISKALSIGAKGFVAKPFTREKLFQYIQRCPTISSIVNQ